jgi:hypothetical protein
MIYTIYESLESVVRSIKEKKNLDAKRKESDENECESQIIAEEPSKDDRPHMSKMEIRKNGDRLKRKRRVDVM